LAQVEDYRIGQSIGLVFCLFALPMVLADPDDTVTIFFSPEVTREFRGQYYKTFYGRNLRIFVIS
jgi:hypothetical protein